MNNVISYLCTCEGLSNLQLKESSVQLHSFHDQNSITLWANFFMAPIRCLYIETLRRGQFEQYKIEPSVPY